MGQDYFRESIEQSRDYGDLFGLVRGAVKRVLGQKRSGLMLYLGDLPLRIGAFHQIGSNGIVLNRRILDIFSRSTSSIAELNSFIFTLLLHEYLHSLGYIDEGEVRELVHEISSEVFGAEHLTVQMALDLPLPKILPPDMHYEASHQNLELVKDFDKSEQPYIA